MDEDLLPVRMINEVVFCPRLFWLEEVAGSFEDNAHTVLGRVKHERVDKPGGPMPAPDEDGAPWHSRALWLSSAALGVSGKVDLVDVLDDGSVMPVDTKKGGSPPKDALWPADEVQLVLQALLLREAGYRVEKVAAYYAAERRRAEAPLTDERIARAKAAIEDARRWRESTVAPPPLVDSPKCLGCSLAPICQPDEVHALDQGIEASEAQPLRRVVPEGQDELQVVVTSPTARVGLHAETLEITDKDDKGEPTSQRIGLRRIAGVSVYGRAQITTAAIHALSELGLPVDWFTTGGFYKGRMTSTESRLVHVRMAQFASAGADKGLEIARVLVQDKIANCRTLLRRNASREGAENPEEELSAEGAEASTETEGKDLEIDLRRLRMLVDEAGAAENRGLLLAREGEAAKRYWARFSELVARDEPAFAMAGRTRRPPRDATNAMISFLAGMLVRDCSHAVTRAGLDAFLGVYHTPHHGRPSLALDLMEPFRPLVVDSVVLGVIRRGEVTPRGFARTGQAVAMDSSARRAVAAAYERRMTESVTHPRFGYRVSYRQVLGIQARLLARALSGEIPAMVAFRTR